MKKLNIKKQLFIMSLALALLVLVGNIINITTIADLYENTDEMHDNATDIKHLESLKLELLSGQTCLIQITGRQYLDSVQLQKFNAYEELKVVQENCNVILEGLEGVIDTQAYQEKVTVYTETVKKVIERFDNDEGFKGTTLLYSELLPMYNELLEGLDVEIEQLDQEGEAYVKKGDDIYRYAIIKFLIITLFSAAFVATFIWYCNKILKRLQEKVGYLVNSMKKGDLDVEVTVEKKDEFGLIVLDLMEGITSIKNIISDIAYMTGEVAKGNLTVRSKRYSDYIGSYKPIIRGFEAMLVDLNKIMQRIIETSEQVESGSGQVSAGAQSLAEGTTSQAAAIQELVAAVEEMTRRIEDTAKDANEAKKTNEDTKKALLHSSQEMDEMVDAMDKINEKSREIGKIIKVIDDIAFQTNILSLNAAVEAARAGEAGKGFAVVAEEVRNLATKSAQSAKDTAALIEETMLVVEKGNKIASETKSSINVVFDNAGELSELVEAMAAASEEEAKNANLINVGVEEISDVVQTNSATAQESAAASEELSSLAHILKSLIVNFKLKKEGTKNTFSFNREVDVYESEVDTDDERMHQEPEELYQEAEEEIGEEVEEVGQELSDELIEDVSSKEKPYGSFNDNDDKY